MFLVRSLKILVRILQDYSYHVIVIIVTNSFCKIFKDLFLCVLVVILTNGSSCKILEILV